MSDGKKFFSEAVLRIMKQIWKDWMTSSESLGKLVAVAELEFRSSDSQNHNICHVMIIRKTYSGFLSKICQYNQLKNLKI